MLCKHLAIRCTDNRFFCLLCGAEIDPPKPQEEKPKPASGVADDKQEGQEKKPAEAPKRAVKRKAKKEDKQHDADIDL